MRTFAGIASLPGRPLERVIRSLLPQVSTIGVFLNGYGAIPIWLKHLSVEHDIEIRRTSENRGSSSKLAWHYDLYSLIMRVGYYFACDDDLEYPPDYVERMLVPFQEWGNGIIVTACGRTLTPDARSWYDSQGERRYVAAVPEARWINYLGGCAFAFHTSLQLPRIDPPNEEEAVLSVWAQQHEVSIRLIERPYDWPKRIPLAPGAFTLYEQAAGERFATRSRIIQEVSPWQIHQPVPSPVP